MLGFDPEISGSSLHLWVAAGSAALLAVFCMAAMFRAVPSLRVEVLVLGALLGAAIAWSFLDRGGSAGDLRAERRALEERAGELSARTLAPGSPLSCLDAVAGETIEAACEKAIFVSPASVATATSYVAARLTLLSDTLSYVGRGGTDIDPMLLPLRRALEADRFGFLAHLLAVRDGCTGENCGALALLHDAGRVRAHLSEGGFDQLLEHYSTAWAQPPEGALADATQARPATTPQPSAPAPHKPVNIDFPTAASIPPVSIMTPEPSGPVLPGVAAAAASNPNPQPGASPARRPRKQASPAPQPPAQSASPTAAVEPIWPEPVPPAPAAKGPTRLNPFPPPSGANAGMTVGAQ